MVAYLTSVRLDHYKKSFIFLYDKNPWHSYQRCMKVAYESLSVYGLRKLTKQASSTKIGLMSLCFRGTMCWHKAILLDCYTKVGVMSLHFRETTCWYGGQILDCYTKVGITSLHSGGTTCGYGREILHRYTKVGRRSLCFK